MTRRQLDELTARVAEAFPELRWKSSHLITEGWDHAVVILDDQWVFRFPLEPDYEQQLGEEIRTLKALAPTLNVQIPQYSLIATKVDFAGYRMVRGQSLTPERFHALSQGVQRQAIDQLSEFLT